ncbi:bifunctional hydroxymethylpyrimidine kinase/phosphomethylpyrimidine kinase [Butyrivibrio sp. FC2001]|uniref:bifunctional hydroxymethylpyrimidine kinase/phosphomethylpyrimidine kinase n=1 Tax=Butyrivibrio sp. FC2001 TaxID=1280671 RepID=UPI00042A4EEB|nr:bifunctional hydroxymethylpyrimidine kinase/phosphomethylpyrimidine kinase [Butyrivibrio sp. FC2001]
MDREKLKLYLVTNSDGMTEEDFLYRIEEAIKGGVTIVQIREKDKSTREYIELAEKVHEVTKKYDVPLIVDDRIDVAMAIGAEGVHLGQSDMPVKMARKMLGDDFIIGATTKTVEQAKEAYESGADYLGVGAIYPTTTKVKTVLTSVDTLRDICEAVPIPANAIGGLNADNIQILSGVPIAGICVVSAIMKAENTRKAAEKLRCAFACLGIDAGATQNPPERFIQKKESTSNCAVQKTVLSIAGSDPSGGAGIQADIKTIEANGAYGMSVITALTAQNTLGVTGILPIEEEFITKELDAVCSDIRPDAVKIGMLSDTGAMRAVAEVVDKYELKNVVLDPVLGSTSGTDFSGKEAVEYMKGNLFSRSTIITPNIPEAEILSGMTIASRDDMIKAARLLHKKYGCSVLVKGGHCTFDNADAAADLLYCSGGEMDEDFLWLAGERIDNPNTHGTGCTLSSAIAANLAKGMELKEAVIEAKTYIGKCIAAGLDLGHGRGPLCHVINHK